MTNGYVVVYRLEGMWLLFLALAGVAASLFFGDYGIAVVWGLIALADAYVYGSLGKIIKDDGIGGA